ncbi:MAG: methyltransferase domain-containing protein [Spirochaetaceae bacterium]|jgi:SAM-dependent methyltransferase|nr:methyltransferase domain-containing protein [Spirochaetaceae bacterium]
MNFCGKVLRILKKFVKAVTPYGIVILFRRMKAKKTLIAAGDTHKNYCPICRKTSYFEQAGFPPRSRALCPHCRSVERHRLLWLFLRQNTRIFSETTAKILHVAAEPFLEKRLRKLYGKNYITADLYNPNAMVQMDIMDIRYPDETFDVIICNHVLEHVADDIKAMNELHRVLKKTGWAVLLVPIGDREKTYEDSRITSEGGRFWAFGQKDHLRKYGKDYTDRLRSAGFTVSVIGRNALADTKKIQEMGLKEDSETWGFIGTEIFFCVK